MPKTHTGAQTAAPRAESNTNYVIVTSYFGTTLEGNVPNEFYYIYNRYGFLSHNISINLSSACRTSLMMFLYRQLKELQTIITEYQNTAEEYSMPHVAQKALLMQKQLSIQAFTQAVKRHIYLLQQLLNTSLSIEEILKPYLVEDCVYVNQDLFLVAEQAAANAVLTTEDEQLFQRSTHSGLIHVTMNLGRSRFSLFSTLPRELMPMIAQYIDPTVPLVETQSSEQENANPKGNNKKGGCRIM